jgi:hypothetical protein
MKAVVLDNGAASGWLSIGEGDDGVRNGVAVGMSSQPAQDDLRRVVSFAPPLIVDPAPEGGHVLGTL